MAEWGGTARAEAFTTSGTWTRPSGIEWVDVLLVGGGGAGGGTASGSTFGGGGGGAEVRFRRVYVNGNLTITIGAGGSGDTSSGEDGEDSTVALAGVTVFSAVGGGGGTTGGSGGGGDGGGTLSDDRPTEGEESIRYSDCACSGAAGGASVGVGSNSFFAVGGAFGGADGGSGGGASYGAGADAGADEHGGTNAVANTGAGGGGSGKGFASGGDGGSGYCIVYWVG